MTRSASIRIGLAIGLTAVTVAACGGSSGGSASNSSASSSSALGSSASSSSASSSSASSSSATTPAASTATSSASVGASGSGGSASAAEAEIRQVWTSFFNSATPPQQKVTLLQNGQRYASYLNSQSSNPNAHRTSAQVSNVKVTGDTATVTYTLMVSGKPALTNDTGNAVLENGKWKVSDASFCTLLSLEGGAPTGCASVPGVGSLSPAVSPTSSG